ncbi:glycosyltransferase family 4 protein [Actinoplanes philippinensis]|uniref:glycosyltransferase family 4 protein n=1 Tax=Actinoplanes philippinensis TaxID=35752 RepID=UPI0033EC9CB8
MKILVVTNLWPENGGYRGIFVREQVDALRALGLTVDVEVVAQSRGRADYLLAAGRVRRRVRDGGYDVVHIHYGLAALAARLAGTVPQVLTLHGSDVQVPWQARFTRLGAGRVAQRIYVSQRLADAAGEPDGLVIPGAVDFGLFTPIDRATARERLGLDPDRPVALFGANPAQVAKRYDVFQRVLDRIRDRGLPVDELVLAEPGQSRADVPLKFAAADVLLFTSRQGHEGSPTVVKEATVMGLPVVTTDVGDVTDILGPIQPSAVVPFPPGWGSEESVEHLVEALTEPAARILRDPVRSDGRDHNAWLAADRIAERIADVYRRVAAT